VFEWIGTQQTTVAYTYVRRTRGKLGQFLEQDILTDTVGLCQ